MTLGVELRERGVGREVPDQIELAQQLYDGREKTVQQIAQLVGVPRTTVDHRLKKMGTRRR